jgi:3',5'-cyclic AMP phosphodiesterase CpdA
MFLLAHLSDLHLAVAPQLSQLAGKRGLGFINWHRGHKHAFGPQALDALAQDLKTFAADHIAVTGDLVNFSVPTEYRRAREWLQSLGPASKVTVVPGNHDIYVPAARHWPAEFWGDYMGGDDGDKGGTFPFLRRRGCVALIALCSALPTAPLLATGRLGEHQLRRLAAMLVQTRDCFRVVLIHHPPISAPNHYLRRLTDNREFRGVLAENGAELVLHGHDHRRSVVWLDGAGKPIPAIGVPSASMMAAHGSKDGAGYNLFRIEESVPWRCELIARGRGRDGSVGEVGRQALR